MPIHHVISVHNQLVQATRPDNSGFPAHDKLVTDTKPRFPNYRIEGLPTELGQDWLRSA